MNRKYWDLASGAGVLVLAGALFIGAMNVKTLDVSRFGAGFSPRSWPSCSCCRGA